MDVILFYNFSEMQGSTDIVLIQHKKFGKITLHDCELIFSAADYMLHNTPYWAKVAFADEPYCYCLR